MQLALKAFRKTFTLLQYILREQTWRVQLWHKWNTEPSVGFRQNWSPPGKKNPVISNGWPGTPLSPTHEIFIQTLDFTLQLFYSQRVQRRVLDTRFCMFLWLIQGLLNHVHFHQKRLGWLFEVLYGLLYLKFHPRETWVFFWKWFRLWTNGKLR